MTTRCRPPTGGEVVVKGSVDEVVIVCGTPDARHRRSYGLEELIFEPRHYRPCLERKTGAFDHVTHHVPEEFLACGAS